MYLVLLDFGQIGLQNNCIHLHSHHRYMEQQGLGIQVCSFGHSDQENTLDSFMSFPEIAVQGTCFNVILKHNRRNLWAGVTGMCT